MAISNEDKLRELAVKTILSWETYTEKNGKHKWIIDVYNKQTKLPRGYKVKYTDAWCATTVSAVGVKLGISDVMFPECSCSKMIDLYKKAGRWEEKDSYVPKKGDLIMYDWDDNGVGDNTGAPEHVGMVIDVDKTNIYVMEGNYNDAMGRRTVKINGKFIRGFCLPDYAKAAKTYNFPAEKTTTTTTTTTSTTSTTTSTATKTTTTVVNNVTLPELKKNCSGDSVKVLQMLLLFLGFACGEIDGTFGVETETAVKAYQKAVGLTGNGVCGDSTWENLIAGKKKK